MAELDAALGEAAAARQREALARQREALKETLAKQVGRGGDYRYVVVQMLGQRCGYIEQNGYKAIGSKWAGSTKQARF